MEKLKSSFVLKKYKDNEKLVELQLSFGYKEYNAIKDKYSYKPLRYYTGIKVNPNEWDNTNKIPHNAKKRNELLNIQQIAQDIFNYLIQGKEEITPQLFKQELDAKIKGISLSRTVIRLVDYIREVILKSTNGRSKLTLREYTKLANKLETFETERNIQITAENLNEVVYLDFMNEIKEQVNKINSVWAVSKTLRSVLNEISRVHKVKVFNPVSDLSKTVQIPKINEEKPYMDFPQIQTILKYTPPNERLQNTKLILTTLLFTGCRYSDVFKIQPDFEYNKEGVKFRYTRFIDQKTGKDIIIPLLKPLEEAIKANGNKAAYPITDVKFNLYVKELAKLAGLDEEITLSFTNSHGKKEYEVKPFYDFVTSHIGRRSFITNLINYVPVTILSKITGHALTNKNVIFSYNKISLLDNAALFVKELKRVTKSNPKEFPIPLM